MHKKHHKKFKILDILAVTTQAREGIETYNIYLWVSLSLCNNSSPWGHWNNIRRLEFKRCKSNNSSPWGHWNVSPVFFANPVNRNNSSPWGHWNYLPVIVKISNLVTTQAREGIETAKSARWSIRASRNNLSPRGHWHNNVGPTVLPFGEPCRNEV